MRRFERRTLLTHLTLTIIAPLSLTMLTLLLAGGLIYQQLVATLVFARDGELGDMGVSSVRNELGEYSDRLMEITSGIDTTRCGIFWGVRPGEGLHITADEAQAGQIAAQWDLLGLPADLLQFEPSACHVFWSGAPIVPADPVDFEPE